MLWSDSGSGGIKGGSVGDEMTEGGLLNGGFPDFQPTQVNGPKTPLKQRQRDLVCFVSMYNKFLPGDFSSSAISINYKGEMNSNSLNLAQSGAKVVR